MPVTDRIVLAHISDIHMGSVKNGFYRPSKKRAGWNGHAPLLSRLLPRDLLRARAKLSMREEEPLYVVVTGDLTCIGLMTEISLASTYLRSILTFNGSGTKTAGLKLASNHLFSVPGNHDHWHGNYWWPLLPAHNPAIFPDCFEPTPVFYPPLESSGKGFWLHLFGIDSNSGLAGQRYNYRAGGSLSKDELNALEAKLKQSQADERVSHRHVIRAILCHHAFSNKGRAIPPSAPPAPSQHSATGRPWWARFFGQNPDPLDPSSVKRLTDLARTYSVSAILTGHTHYPFQERNPAIGFPAVWELRCHTTLQGPPNTATQGFLLHEIKLTGKPDSLVWSWRACDYRTGRFNIPSNAVTLK